MPALGKSVSRLGGLGPSPAPPDPSISPEQRFQWGCGRVGARGALTLLCPREQWRAAAWASPSFVLLC